MKSNRGEEFAEDSFGFQVTKHRTNDAPLLHSQTFLQPPVDPAGRRFDLSDRPLMCSSTNLRNEVIVGGSDHALYSIDINDEKRRPITMYTKKCGHTDWVSSVSHLVDGKVLSGGMDGKLCLWSDRVRTQCVELRSESTLPITKVISDYRYNIGMSCCYDGSITIWNFIDASGLPDNRSSHLTRGSGRTMSSQRAAPMSTVSVPSTQLLGHSEAVLECAYRGNTFVSGDKGGFMMMWDMNIGEPKHRFRAHPAGVTAIECLEDENTIITCGTDGYVKIWDPRTDGSGLVHKIPAHIRQNRNPERTAVRTIGGRVTSVDGRQMTTSRTTGKSDAKASRTSGGGVEMIAGAISCMSTVGSRGSSGGTNYIITGSGSPPDSSVAVTDIRSSFKPVIRWTHQQNGVYSLCAVGEECVLSGDGRGMLFSNHLLLAEEETGGMDFSFNDRGGKGFSGEIDGDNKSLKYGLGASEMGAVRSINCVNGKVVTAGEDGKVLIFDYSGDRIYT